VLIIATRLQGAVFAEKFRAFDKTSNDDIFVVPNAVNCRFSLYSDIVANIYELPVIQLPLQSNISGHKSTQFSVLLELAPPLWNNQG
jgi:hypothetical protein